MELSEEYKEWLCFRYGDKADQLLSDCELLTAEQLFQKLDSIQENDPRPKGSGNSEQSRIISTAFPLYDGIHQ